MCRWLYAPAALNLNNSSTFTALKLHWEFASIYNEARRLRKSLQSVSCSPSASLTFFPFRLRRPRHKNLKVIDADCEITWIVAAPVIKCRRTVLARGIYDCRRLSMRILCGKREEFYDFIGSSETQLRNSFLLCCHLRPLHMIIPFFAFPFARTRRKHGESKLN